MERHYFIYIITFILLLPIQAFAQYPRIDLEEALKIARKNHAGLETGRLLTEQRKKMVEAGILHPPTQIFISSEEFDVKDQKGLHSLNFQQNFYLPKTIAAQKEVYQSAAHLATRQLALTDRTLEWQVTKAYYQVLVTREELGLARENLALFVNFKDVTHTQLTSGETGIIPKLAARSRLGQAQLELDHAEERFEIARTLFNQLIRSDIHYDVQGELPSPSSFSFDSLSMKSPQLQVKQAEIKMASAKVEQQRSQLLPQINSGLRIQTMDGDFPLFGYQLGVNVPFFKKAYRGQIEAAEIGVKLQESKLKETKNQIEQTLSELRFRLEHQLHVLVYLQEELAPIVNEQKEVIFAAYREGEVGYLEYLDSLEQVTEVKQQLLHALYEFNTLKLELDYWLGN